MDIREQILAETSVKHPELIRQAKRYRMELLFLGMALARDGDREKILSEIGLEDLETPVIKAVYKALLSKDSEDVESAKKIFRRFGLECEGQSLRDVLIREIRSKRNES